MISSLLGIVFKSRAWCKNTLRRSIKRFFLSLLLLVSHLAQAGESPFTLLLSQSLYSLNPFTSSGSAYWEVRSFVIETLGQRELGQDLPALAVRWEVSRDHRSYTFYLRPGVRWHEGAPFTSQDVQFSFDALFDSRFPVGIWRDMFKNIERAEIIDPLTVRFHAKSASFADFRNLFSYLQILPKHRFTVDTAKLWTKSMVGTGPYRLKSFTPGEALDLERNPQWWGFKAPGPDQHTFQTVRIKFVSDQKVAAEIIAKGKGDGFAFDDLGLKREIDSDKRLKRRLQVVSWERHNMTTYWGILLNLKDPRLRSKDFRLALNQLWDRDFVKKKFFADAVGLAETLWPPGLFPARQTIAYDPKRARAVLSKWGGDPLEIIYDQKELEPFLTFYQRDAAAAGLKVKLRQIDSSSLWKILNQRNFQAYAYRAGVTGDLLKSMYHSKGEFNSGNVSDETSDRMLERLDQEFNPEARRKLSEALAERLLSLTPEVLGFTNPKRFFLASKRVQVPATDPRMKFWKFNDRMQHQNDSYQVSKKKSSIPQ